MNTIALNMIVGPGDADLLKRCLDSFDAIHTFDEIVIVLTTEDDACANVAKQYTTEVFNYKWTSKKYPHGNFAGARNLALQNTHSDYVMWLDCDDLPSNDFLLSFSNIRGVTGNYDYFTLDYVVAEGASVSRERIFKRTSDLFWQYPVHEYLTIDKRIHTSAHIRNIRIIHAPVKAAEHSTGRNLQILAHECKAGHSPVMQFYYGRELMNIHDVQGVAILEGLLLKNSVNSDMSAQVCVLLCGYYKAIGKMDGVETLSRIGISFNSSYADFLINLANIYEGRKELREAIILCQKALECKFAGGGVYNVDLYGFVPAVKLIELHLELGELEQSLLFCKLALQTVVKEDRAKLIEVRSQILHKLIEENI